MSQRLNLVLAYMCGPVPASDGFVLQSSACHAGHGKKHAYCYDSGYAGAAILKLQYWSNILSVPSNPLNVPHDGPSGMASHKSWPADSASPTVHRPSFETAVAEASG